MTRHLAFLWGAIVLLGISACQKYQVSLNDNVVYTPAGVFKNYQIADQALADCVAQTIYDLHVTRVEQITQLNCSNAGIKSLAGLAKFYELKALNLADNHLIDIKEIGKLGRLQVLILNNNQIEDASPLLHLLHLQDLQLEKNSQLDCSSVNQIRANLEPLKASILLPEQCR
jgi:Leucine-rich repeat (LRR) protein